MVDRRGEKYGYLTVIERADSPDKSYILWRCLCDCGVYINAKAGNLNSGNTTSCGCKSSRLSVGERSFKHGHNRPGCTTTEYYSWAAMIQRCTNPKNPAYLDYGGRGIRICDRWVDKEKGFINFIDDMGYKPSKNHSLDRFPNNSTGNYEPSNCRWGTDEQQCKNRRSNKWYELGGINKIQKEWAESIGVNYKIFHSMLKRKSFEETYNYYKNKKNL